jgi:Protein of unknown function (DUF2470)
VSWLTPDVVNSVATHMNEDHRDDLLIMISAQGPDAVVAEVTGLDTTSLHVRAELPDGATQDIALAWPGELTQRSDIRKYVVQLHDQALAPAANVNSRQAPQRSRTDPTLTNGPNAHERTQRSRTDPTLTNGPKAHGDSGHRPQP